MKEKLELIILKEIYNQMEKTENNFPVENLINLLYCKDFKNAIDSLKEKFEIIEVWDDEHSAIYDSIKVYKITSKGIHRYLMDSDEEYREKINEETDNAKKIYKNLDFELFHDWLIYRIDKDISFLEYYNLFDRNPEKETLLELK